MKNKWHLILLIFLSFLMLTGCSLKGLPDPQVPEASRVLDSSGQLVTTIGEQNRIPVNLEDVSPHMSQALLAIEDTRFYNHKGIDVMGLARAAYVNLRARKVVEGGSTITQQLAKNLYLTHDRTVVRKLKEMYYAIQLERHYTKDEILNQYLNAVYFGQGAYGVEAAARIYFQKKASELTLAESAMLAGFVRGPGIYPEPGNFDLAKERQALVLQRMAEVGYISDTEREQAADEIIELAVAPLATRRAAYFVAEIIEELGSILPGGKEAIYTQGLQIETTLDLKMQLAAEQAVAEILEDRDDELQAALVAINPENGHITAMVGGRNYGESQFNRALAKRQPGSAFKPFVYATALEQGLTAANTYFCKPTEIPQPVGEPYRPSDYGEKYHYRSFTLKEALKISDNVVAVQVNNQVGPRAVADLARRLGIQSKLDPVHSLALGTSEVSPLEMASAFGVFANGGIAAKPIYFTRVMDRDGQELISRRTELSRVMDERHSYIITDMMKSVFEPGGTAEHLSRIINRPAAGKTGTTDNYNDAWFVGYTPQVTAAVYVGYDVGNQEEGGTRPVGTGSAVAGPIWASFISNALSDETPEDFTVPSGIVFREVSARDGLLPSPATADTIEVAFIEGTEPVITSTGDRRRPGPGQSLREPDRFGEDEDEDEGDELDLERQRFTFPWNTLLRGRKYNFLNGN
ncbi:transglycosylase domain-containing protein [Desulfofalx alkaliphila]|uniref:transglycosylase domain-containing protein n=1 Tax=Desulfofalx alkaliphila TaxID=105483 RepID=UPI000689CD18|nr:PBP1A family penicillin-binding protein [Desulfofalx alkaliphila]